MSTTTDWIIALSSTAAAAGTVGTLYATVLVLQRQQDEARRQQASRVTATTATQVGEQTPRLIRIHNDSDRAIYDVMTWIFADGMQQLGDDQHRIIRPGQPADVGLGSGRHYLTGRPLPWRIEVVFTDEAGHRWIREADGALREAPNPAPTRRARLKGAALNARQRWRDRRANG